MNMSNFISSDYAEVERTLRETVEFAEYFTGDDTLLVAGIHPDVLDFFREQLGLPEDAMLGGIASAEYIMVSEDVPGFCVVICNGNL